MSFEVIEGEAMNDEVENLLERWTEYGCTVGNLRVLSDHYLVQKVRIKPMSEGQYGIQIALPDQYVRRSVGNLVLIKARVILASAPFASRHVGKRVVGLDANSGEWRHKYPLRYGTLCEPRVQAGEGIVYNGFNMGKVYVNGLAEPLIFVRGIDIEMAFPPEFMDQIQVGDFAMSRSGEAMAARGSLN